VNSRTLYLRLNFTLFFSFLFPDTRIHNSFGVDLKKVLVYIKWEIRQKSTFVRTTTSLRIRTIKQKRNGDNKFPGINESSESQEIFTEEND